MFLDTSLVVWYGFCSAGTPALQLFPQLGRTSGGSPLQRELLVCHVPPTREVESFDAASCPRGCPSGWHRLTLGLTVKIGGKTEGNHRRRGRGE